MSAAPEILGRILAYKERRAVAVRESFALAPDSGEVFAIAPIKLVSEQIVQAVAFGNPDGQPDVLVRWNPLSRDSVDLERLAAALDAYVSRKLSLGEIPRIWLPHDSALTLVDLIGHRYRTNEKASPALRKLGWQCRVFAEEASYAGQQTVAIAGDLLRTHVVTGQPPTKDAHLGALLAWINPPAGSNPAEEADRRALVPASGVLIREVDDEVERLRRDAKRGGARGENAKRIIEARLEAGARREWDLLVEARRAYWSLPLEQSDALGDLVVKSIDRISYQLRNELSPARSPHALSKHLDGHEHSMELAESAAIQGDALVRELFRKKGRVIRTTVSQILQPRPKFNPCSLVLRVEQPVIRLRPGSKLVLVQGKVHGRVERVEELSGRTMIFLGVTKGVRAIPALGATMDWTDSIPEDFSFRKNRVYESMKDANSPRVYGRDMEPRATTAVTVDLLGIANSLKKGRRV